MYVLELGGEDHAFAACEAESAATAVTPMATGLVRAGSIDAAAIARLAYTHRANELVGHTDASVESARLLLESATFDREGSVAVRARDIQNTANVSTQQAERVLGGVLVDRGFTVDLDDPDHTLRALFADDVCALGWEAAASLRDYGDRNPTARPFFQPGSMEPLLARALVNIAGAGPGRTLLDPMCGTGGVLLEGGLVGARLVGNDAQWKMVRGTKQNLTELLPDDADFGIVRGDATALALRDDSVDAVVFDAPYGRQSKIANLDLADLVAGALAEARRVGEKCVLVADRPWAEEARAAGWEVTHSFERYVHGTLTRHILVLE
ncbi:MULTISPECIES: methyltransferase domain-containing protein [unclassified Haladaptatus]|uniref:methyltransferase domain-containing protein n=1 Tax=unclassified Haladaptatus TaxID=2622732 RepID=UPI0023E8E2CE|nr:MULTISPECIES: methyltransferase domain-containing protein [unclassified Haladaptatus]